jgi:hypothetical protein
MEEEESAPLFPFQEPEEESSSSCRLWWSDEVFLCSHFPLVLLDSGERNMSLHI